MLDKLTHLRSLQVLLGNQCFHSIFCLTALVNIFTLACLYLKQKNLPVQKQEIKIELKIQSLKTSLDISCSNASQVNTSSLIGFLDILTRKEKKNLIKIMMFCLHFLNNMA